MVKAKVSFFLFSLLLGNLYAPIPAYSENFIFDSNGYCWENCPVLDAGATINSFTTARGLEGYRALPLVLNTTTQIHGLRVGLNYPYGNMWTATGVLIHQSGTRYSIRTPDIEDGNKLSDSRVKCGLDNVCSPSFLFGGDYTNGWFAGSYKLEITFRYNYNINPSWSKTILLPGALVIVNSQAGTGPTTTTTVATAPSTTVNPASARPTIGGRCFNQRWTYKNLVCKRINNQLVWRKK